MVFKTTLNCSSCVRSVSDALNAAVGEGNWSVDTVNPEKLLTVKRSDKSASLIQQVIEDAGFEAALISSTD